MDEDKERFLPKDARVLPGKTLFFSSLDELRNLFGTDFKIIEEKIIRMSTENKPHIGNYFFLERL